MRSWAVAFGVLLSARAAAADPPRQAVIEVTAGEHLRFDSPYGASLRQAIEALAPPDLRGAGLAREVEQHLSRRPSERTDEALERLRRLLDDGIYDFYHNHFDDSVRKLTAAGSELGQAIDRVGQSELTSRRLFESQILLAVTLRYQRMGEQAAVVLGNCIRVFPQYRPGTADFSPEIVELYDAIRETMDARETGTIDVETDPLGCAVMRDGALVGTTPMGPIRAYMGPHTIQVRCNDRLSRVRSVTVSDVPKRIRIDAAVDAAIRSDDAAAWLVPGPGMLAAAVEIGRALRLERVVLFRRSAQGLSLEEVDVARTRVARSSAASDPLAAVAGLSSTPASRALMATPGGGSHSLDALDGVLLSASAAGILGGTALAIASVAPGRRCASTTIDHEGDCAYLEVPGNLWPVAGIIAAGVVAGGVLLVRLIAGDSAEAR